MFEDEEAVYKMESTCVYFIHEEWNNLLPVVTGHRTTWIKAFELR